MHEESVVKSVQIPHGAALDPSSEASDSLLVRWDRIIALVLVQLAFASRLWALDAKGLAYDEAATALMSRASVPEIIAFHWTAAFEHLPLWILLMRAWSQMAGQTEFALRFPSILACVATVALTWALLRKARRQDLALRTLTAALVILSPVLSLYAQEARMYALVVALSVVSAFLLLEYLDRPRGYLLAGLLAVNVSMLGLQYYAALLIGAEALFLLLLVPSRYIKAADSPGLRSMPILRALAGVAFPVIPLALWMAFSPGFHQTMEVVWREASDSGLSSLTFLNELWLDLSFGAIRWQPAYASIGLLLLPILLVGMFAALRAMRTSYSAMASSYALWPLLMALLAVAPIVVSALLFRTVAARYILYVAPFLFAFIAYGILVLWRMNRPFGALAAIVVLVIAATGLLYYLGPYTKSEYREMTQFLQRHFSADTDVVLIEAPRQHILAKYYLGQDFPLQPVPDMSLPDYWPLTAPKVVPELVDDLVQAALTDSTNIWAVFSAEAEVDSGEFLAKYLSAVSFPYDCWEWLDVRLCLFVAPKQVQPDLSTEIHAGYSGGLVLERAHLTLDAERQLDQSAPLFATLDWWAEETPDTDYKVSVRLISSDGEVISQADKFPIGPLLPPTTWHRDDRKPGYAVIHIPDHLPPGDYAVQAEVYDPNTLLSLPAQTRSGQTDVVVHELGRVEISDTMRLLPPKPPGRGS